MQRSQAQFPDSLVKGSQVETDVKDHNLTRARTEDNTDPTNEGSHLIEGSVTHSCLRKETQQLVERTLAGEQLPLGAGLKAPALLHPPTQRLAEVAWCVLIFYAMFVL